MQTLLDAWKKRCFRKSALWIYGKRDRCIDHLCKRITGGVPGTLVAFGGAASCSTGFGHAPAPQKRLRARLAKVHGAHVSIIRETFTSQRCCICRNWFGNEEDANGKKIWALKRCTQCRSSKGGDLYWNRDRNASLNILQVYLSLAESGLRPPEFDFPSRT